MSAATELCDPTNPVELAIARLRAGAAVSHPAEWARKKLGIDMYSQQIAMCDAVVANNRVAIRSSHEVGKTFTVAVLVLWWIDTHPIGNAFVITTAPSAPQLKAVLWREINKLFELAKTRGNPLPGRLNQTEWWIGNRIVAMGRKPADWDTDAFQGIHDEYVLAIIEEANGVPRPMWTGVEGVTSNDTSKVVAVGNPDDPDSEFARVSTEENKVWFKMRVSAFDTPAFTGEKVHPRLLRVLVGKNWVEARKTDWGEDSPLYISRVLGEFPDLDTSKQKVVPAGAVAARLEPPEGRVVKTPVELGMDVAASEEGDETVIRERRGMQAGRRWSIRTSDPEKAAELAVKAAIESGATMIKVDEIGWGWGIVSTINVLLKQKKLRCRAVGVNVGRKAYQPEKFYNLRSELWWMARDLSKDGGWVLHGMDEADVTVGQLCDPNWHEVSGGRIQVESKDETRKRLGRSPDDADALILAFARPTKSGGVATVKRAGAGRKGAVRSTSTPAARKQMTTGRRRASLVAQRHG